VFGLRDFETLGGSIEKIETSVAELKIIANFRGVIHNFPFKLLTVILKAKTNNMSVEVRICMYIIYIV
jgi:hypothetical protein